MTDLTKSDIKVLATNYDKASAYIALLYWRAEMVRLSFGITGKRESDKLKRRADWMSFVIGDTEIDPREVTE